MFKKDGKAVSLGVVKMPVKSEVKPVKKAIKPPKPVK